MAEGFLNIDCGLEANNSGYTDPQTGLFFVSDEPYVDGGEVSRLSPEDTTIGSQPRYAHTVRTFPSGTRNCYMLPTVQGTKYLLRVGFIYGSYEYLMISNSLSAAQFELHLGVEFWTPVDRVKAMEQEINEAVLMAPASWLPVCLLSTGSGTPFVSYMQVIQLPEKLYPPVSSPDQTMSRYKRYSMGPATGITRYPDDKYDRFWWQMEPDETLSNLATTSTIELEDTFAVPMPVLQTAITAAGNMTKLNITTWHDSSLTEYMVFLHFADFQNSQFRQFDADMNDNQLGTKNSISAYHPSYLAAGCVFSSNWLRANDGDYIITLVGTAVSVLPPMLNAFEIYKRIPHKNLMTFHVDFDTIMAIKLEYGIKKNWIGDPCFHSWDGVECSDSSGNNTRIISLDLSNCNLHGVISNRNLSGNQLNGPIPDSLCKTKAGLAIYRYGSDGNICNATVALSPSRKRATILVVSVVAVVLVVFTIFVLAYLVWRAKTKPNISIHDINEELRLKYEIQRRQYHENHLQTIGTRRFSYKDLEKFTSKFKQFVGKGGFGPVYYGCLDDGTEVAVKIRSKSASSQGLDQFLAEIRSLTKVHHRNLVVLIGYCWEKDHLALVYEYMSRGNLHDHLKGQNDVGETLNWATRLRIVLESAQGLNYLHKGCDLPIIHRDVKSNNILLGQNLQAKIADLGLCKTFLTDTQTHMTATPAGTIGYIDPQYHRTCRLTERIDVYSFGVVLLEVATGESPTLPGQDHIVQRVKQKITSGDINSVADVRLGGAYDICSMWKVVNTAISCTIDDASERPMMASVVAELMECLALEEARMGRPGRVSQLDRLCPVMSSPGQADDSMASVSTFDLSAR
uniref:non-specific serine/threonine protein kinase n=1 Tax=Leersia perrieri TaxID=77586 RepID=A0A0D9XCT1_9ORYZ